MDDEVLRNRQMRFTEKFYGAYVVTVYFRVSDAMLYLLFPLPKVFLSPQSICFLPCRGYPDIHMGYQGEGILEEGLL